MEQKDGGGVQRNFGINLQQQHNIAWTKKLGETRPLNALWKNILEVEEMGRKKGETALFLSMKVKMFG